MDKPEPHLNVIDGMYILHAILHHSPDLLQPFIPTHSGHCVTLYEDIAPCQQLQRLQRAPVRPQYPLSPLHKSLFVAHQVPDLDDICGNTILQDLDCLREWHRPRKQLDQVSPLQNRRRVVGLPCCPHGHRTFDQIERAADLVLVECAGHERPGFTEVDFAVLGEEGGEGGLFGEGAGFVVVGREFIDLA